MGQEEDDELVVYRRSKGICDDARNGRTQNGSNRCRGRWCAGALAQDTAAPALAQNDSRSGEGEGRESLRSGQIRKEVYAEFTAALADELGIDKSDDVDAAIRVAMMTVVDSRVDDGLLTAGQGEALKTLIATSEVPLGPGPMFGPPPGAFIRGGHGPGEDGRFLPIRGGRPGMDHSCQRWDASG